MEEEDNYQWLLPQFKKLQIKNMTFEELNQYFPSTASIELQNYFLVEIGHNIQGKRQLVFFKIMHQGTNLPLLRGPHQIYGCVQGSWCLFWVNSLTRLKHHFMGMYDRLSFERSTYLIHTSSQMLIRLRCMRHRLTVPKMTIPPNTHIWNDPCPQVSSPSVLPRAAFSTPSLTMMMAGRRKAKLNQRTQRQLKRAVQQMYLSYARDLPDLSPEVLQRKLCHDIACILHSF